MNIKNTILGLYHIDIDEVNLIKLYQIKDPNISSDELEKKIQQARKRWSQGANSPDDAVAARDKARLAQADTYEKILRNKKYLSELYEYHKKGGPSDAASSKFAKDFFTSLKGVNKNISQKDFNFFMQYFREERKNEKSILEMLKSEFRAITLMPCSFNDDEEGQSQKNSTPGVVQTRFHKDTLCLLHKCELQYGKVQQSEFLFQKYPNLTYPMYDFLRIEQAGFAEFSMYIDGTVQEVFTCRQNDSANNAAYTPLTEFYNTWKDILKRGDVRENFSTFKLLIKYPKLTPYLYLAEEINIPFLELLVKTFRDEYNFYKLEEFLFVYFKPLADGKHYSFSMDKKLEALLKKIDVNPDTAPQDSQRRNAAAKRRQLIPWPLHILRFLATWPICLVQLLFEIFRFFVINTKELYGILAVFFTVFFAHVFNEVSIFETAWHLINNFRECVADVVYAAARTYDFSVFSFILGLLFLFVQYAFKFALAPAICTRFMLALVEGLDRNIDLEGLHLTFIRIQEKIEQKLIYHYKKMGSRLYSKMIRPIVANLIGTLGVILVLLLVVSLFNFLRSSVF